MERLMAANDLIVNIDGRASGVIAATNAAGKAVDRLNNQMKSLAVATAEASKAAQEFGASSQQAAAKQAEVVAAEERVVRARQQATVAAAREAEATKTAADKSAAATEAAAAKQAAALKKVGTVAGTIGLVLAASLYEGVKAAANFNAQMAQVATLSHASAGAVAALASATKNYAGLGISASQAADAEIELVKAGVSVKDILGGGLDASVRLAAAGQISLADATSIAASAMVQFQLKGSDLGHVADDLTAGADKALGSVQDLGTGLKYAGLLAHQTGLNIDQTVGALAEFAQAGLIGAQGGTTLQQVLRQLTGPTAKASAEMQTLGIHVFDANGKFVGLASIAGQLQTKLGGMSDQARDAALNTLFTSRAVRGATILYQDGAAGVQSWADKVNASGFAAQQASGKLNSLAGDMQKLKAEVENSAISFGQAFQGPLRTITQGLTSFVTVLDDIPGPAKAAAGDLLALTAAVGLGTFAYTRARADVASLAESYGVLTKSAVTAGAATERARLRRASPGTG